MGKSSVSRDAFRSLFAVCDADANPGHDRDYEIRLLKLFQASGSLLHLRGSEPAGSILLPSAHKDVHGGAPYDHASDFLHRLLRDLDQKLH